MSAFYVPPRNTERFTSLSLTFQLSCLWGPLWSEQPSPGRGDASGPSQPGITTLAVPAGEEKRFSQKPSARGGQVSGTCLGFSSLNT